MSKPKSSREPPSNVRLVAARSTQHLLRFLADERVPSVLPRHLHAFWHPGLRRVFLPTDNASQRATDDLRARFQNLESRYRESQEEIERCRVACTNMQAERDRALRDKTQYLDAYVGATIQYRQERERVARRAEVEQPDGRVEPEPEPNEPAQRRRESNGWLALERLGAFLGFGEGHPRIDERTLELQVALGREQRLKDQLEDLNRQMAAKDLELVAKTNELMAKDEQLANKERELIDQDGEIAFMIGELQLKDDQLQEKETEAEANRDQIDDMTRLLSEKEERIADLRATIDEMDEDIHHLEGRRVRRRSALNARSTAQASDARPRFASGSDRAWAVAPLSPPATPRASLDRAATGLGTSASGRRGELLDTPERIPTRARALPRVYVADNRLPTAPVATIVGPCNANASGQHWWRTTGSNGSIRKFTCTGCQYFVEERKSGGPNSYWISNRMD
ncbi:hypothetical protein EIP86_009992 [Pleurotus ostreatoroseus]|nr:hypothetical protein EIP86_009992 [Pleurotus ostreatoroseus]